MAAAPVILRFKPWFRLFMLIGVFFFGGMLGLGLWLLTDPKHADWSLVVGFACLAAVYLVYAVHVWTVRYEFSGAGLIRRGLLPRKAIHWDQLKKVRIAQPDEIRLEGLDGTVLTIPGAFLDGGDQIKALVQEVAGIVPVQEVHGTSQLYAFVRRLPYFAAGGGVASLLFVLFAGRWGLVLGGCGIGVAYAVILMRQLNAQAKGHRPGGHTWGILWLVFYFPLMIMIQDSPGPVGQRMGAVLSGFFFAGCLVLLPFRERILGWMERAGTKSAD